VLCRALYRGGVAENRLTTYKISAAARELGISIEWLRAGERRGFFPPAPRDQNGHRYYTEENLERMRKDRGERKRGSARG
jgi:DNA-binding transcriptional MerR regulator